MWCGDQEREAERLKRELREREREIGWTLETESSIYKIPGPLDHWLDYHRSVGFLKDYLVEALACLDGMRAAMEWVHT